MAFALEMWYTATEVMKMKRFIPYEKLTKKKRREQDVLRRNSWGAINPVTRRPEDSKVYNRRKAQRWDKNPPDELSFISDPVFTGRI